MNPLVARLSGNVTGMEKLLDHDGWKVECDAFLPHQYTMMARKSSASIIDFDN